MTKYTCVFCCKEFSSKKLGKGAVPVCGSKDCVDSFWQAYDMSGGKRYHKDGKNRWVGDWNSPPCMGDEDQ